MFHHLAARRHYGLGALDLQMNKSAYYVGEAPTYTVTGAKPETPILWTSTQNGVASGEQNADYGQRTDASGAWSSSGSAFGTAQQGQWVKTASVGGETDTAPFQVLPLGVQQPTPGGVYYVGVPAASKPASDTINLFGYALPSYAVYIGAAVLLWFMFKGK